MREVSVDLLTLFCLLFREQEGLMAPGVKR